MIYWGFFCFLFFDYVMLNLPLFAYLYGLDKFLNGGNLFTTPFN